MRFTVESSCSSQADSSDSSSEPSLASSIQLYERHQWTKLKFTHESKRVADCPADFELVHHLFRQRFPVLDLLLEQVERPQKLQIFAGSEEIKNTAELLKFKRISKQGKKAMVLEACVVDDEPGLQMPDLPEDFAAGGETATES